MAKKRHYSSSRKDGHRSEEYHAQGMGVDRGVALEPENASHMREEFNDEKKHSRGDERAVYRKFRAMGHLEGFYAGSEPRRRQEMEDAGMIHEDHRAIANLPQYPMIKEYPKTGPYLPEGLDDTIAGVDHQMDYDDSQRHKHQYPKKV